MYEVEIIDRDGRRRPGLLPKLLPVFHEAFRLVAHQGETINVALGLKSYWLVALKGGEA